MVKKGVRVFFLFVFSILLIISILNFASASCNSGTLHCEYITTSAYGVAASTMCSNNWGTWCQWSGSACSNRAGYTCASLSPDSKCTSTVGCTSTAPICTSGPCCTGSDTIAGTGTQCATLNSYWICSANKIYVESQNQYCNGLSYATCSGSISITDSLYEDCASHGGCNPSTFFPTLCKCVSGFGSGRCSTGCVGDGGSPGCCVDQGETCAGKGYTCGTWNICGVSTNCGSCSGGQTCNGVGQCVCTPACSGKNCGSDGCGGSCGNCGSGYSCSLGLCAPICSPATCSSLGKSCGSWDNGCGTGTLNCGTCNDGNSCTTDSCTAGGSCSYTPINCDDGNSCTTDGCSGGTCSHTPLTCSGSSSQLCPITNGAGSQSRTCSCGSWSGWGNCNVISCNSCYTQSGNTCIAATCSGSSSQSCSITHGTGTQTRSCSCGSWSGWGTCLPNSCNSGYTLCGGGCSPNSQSCSITNGAGTQTGYCSSGSWNWNTCTVSLCNSGYVQSGNTCVLAQCSGSSSQSCSITNGAGTQSRTCTNPPTWNSWGTCNVVLCNSCYVQSGNTCIAATCSGSSSQSCSITNGAGTQSRSCSCGSWSGWGTCNVVLCNSGYVQSGNTCILSQCSGSSSQSCSITNGTGTQSRTCSNPPTWDSWGSCTLSSCNSGYQNCNGLVSDGCEINTNTNNNNCGVCGVTCNDNNACTVDLCSSGSCSHSNVSNCCGNRVIDSGEQCDGSALGGATCASVLGTGYTGALSCSSSCQFVTSSCTSPSQVCGNGVREGSEGCDDGNTYNGDGCSSSCNVESGYTCNTATPNVCTPSCVANCAGKNCGSDGCSGTCGTCSGSQTCSSNETCTATCTPTSCLASGKVCGSWTNGTCAGTLSCGTCVLGYACNSNGQCISTCNDTCSSLNYTCGTQTVCGVSTNCGGCSGGQTCDSTGHCITPCDLTSAAWSKTSGTAGDSVKLYINGTNCYGKNITFTVMEEDGLFNPDDPVTTEPLSIAYGSPNEYGTWTMEWQDDTDGGQTNPPEYYFIATVAGTSESVVSSKADADMLDVYKDASTICLGNAYCSDYDTESFCNSDLCKVGESSVSSGCGEVLNPETNCSDYQNCGCAWNTNLRKCEPSWRSGSRCNGVDSSTGTCNYIENSPNTCEAGIRTLDLDASWVWAPGNEITQLDPLGKHLQCVPLKNSIACSASAQVSFFGIYQLAIAVVVVVLIYLIWALRKKKDNKRTRRNSKKKLRR